MTSARRCSTCSINWPVDVAYYTCPICRTRTGHMHDEIPISERQARSAIRHHEFEKFYTHHDAERKGPTPEEIGAREAEEILQLERLTQAPAAD